MQKYIHVTSGRYPVTAQEIKLENPNTSFPQYIQPESARHLGYEPVEDVSPTYDPETQYVRELAPVNFKQVWEVIDYTPEELAQRAADKAAQEAAVIASAKQAFISAVVTATQDHLDAFAKTRNYDGILSACTYASSAIPKFQGEGQYCVNARDSIWAALYTIMAEVEAGTRQMPATVEEVLALLPELSWPLTV